jgi:hypothetical protein
MNKNQSILLLHIILFTDFSAYFMPVPLCFAEAMRKPRGELCTDRLLKKR